MQLLYLSDQHIHRVAIRMYILSCCGTHLCRKEANSVSRPIAIFKSSYNIAQYPILWIAQSVLHFTSLTGLFNQTLSQLLWEASSHMLQLMCEDCLYTYPPLSIARYSFIQPSELEQCRVKKLAQGFNTTAQGSNPGP